VVQHIVNCKQGYAEVLLFQIKERIEKIISKYQGTEPVNLSYDSGDIIIAPEFTNASSPDRKVTRLSPNRLKDLISLPIGLPSLPRGEQTNVNTPFGQSNDKDQLIVQMRDTINTLGIKAEKLETLLALKDKRIEELVEILRKNSLI
jgi:hypothetical protein